MTDSKRIFLSCVSKDLAAHRLPLKAKFAEAGIDLVVQEDFADAGSPYGTLLKIFAQIQQCDMVVQLLGSYQSHKVPPAVCAELLTVRPDFQRWLDQRGLLSAFRAGAITYVEFEGYTALYLGKELFSLRYRNGTQAEYETRLRKLGRHVEAKLNDLGSLLPRVQAQFQQMALVGRVDAQKQERVYRRQSNLALIAIVGICLAFAFFVQLFSAGLIDEALRMPRLFREFAYFIATVFALVFLQCAMMSDQLRFDFVVRTAVRNGSVVLAIFATLSFLSFQAVKWLALIAGSWTWLLIATGVLTALGYWTNPPKQKSLWILAIGVPIIFAFVMLFFLALAWLAAYPVALYWCWTVLAVLVVVGATFYDNKAFVLEVEHGTSDLTPGVKERNTQFFWTARQTVMDARKLDDLGHDF